MVFQYQYYRIEFRHNIKNVKDADPERRLEFITKLDEWGKSIVMAWKSFGHRGPKFHDGFLYGKLDSNMEMTGSTAG